MNKNVIFFLLIYVFPTEQTLKHRVGGQEMDHRLQTHMKRIMNI